jgi:hypothetical protein
MNLQVQANAHRSVRVAVAVAQCLWVATQLLRVRIQVPRES